MYKTMLAAAMLFSTGLSAQNLVGVKGGYVYTNAEADRFSNSARSSFVTGLVFHHIEAKHLLVGAELLLDKRRFSPNVNYTDINGKPIDVNQFYELSYISVPLKIGYQFGNRLFGIGNLGVAPSFLANASYHYPVTTLSKEMTKTSVTSTFSKWDVAGFADLAIGFKVSKKISVLADYRLQYSFTKVKTAAGIDQRFSGMYGTLNVLYTLN